VNDDALAALEWPAIAERLSGLAATDLGQALARNLMPSIDRAEVARLQALTAEAVSLLDAGIPLSLAGIADVRPAVARAARGGTLGPQDLRAIALGVRVALQACLALAEQRDRAPGLATLLADLDTGLAAPAGEIERCVEEDGSNLRDTASPLLRRLRSELRNGRARVRDELARVARSRGVREALQETFLAERAGRPVLAVRASARSSVPGLVHDASSSGQTLFVEPFAVVELNNRLSETAAAAREEAERILVELSTSVAAHAAALQHLVEATAAADLVLASGMLSRRWHGAPVTMSDRVALVGARHPLLDAATAVPIDLELGDLRALVISGPNTGGKTVALKTLGLAALLHQAGVRPPAGEATLPVFDRVLADIGDRQSIEMSLSTFSGHLRTLVAILDDATADSLVLLDEVAVGTDPEEGAALARALVSRLARQARLTVVTTHYPELKEWASATDRVANAATGFDPETDAPLYRIALGRAGTSHALRIAERLGLDAAVVDDARALVTPERARTAELLAEAEAAEREAAATRADADRALAAATAREQELEAKLAALHDSAERVREDARRAAAAELADARMELQRLRKDIRAARQRERERQREAPAAERERDRLLGSATEHAEHAARLLPPREPLETPVPFASGDPVEAPDIGVRGTIAAIRGTEAEVVGAAGQRVRIPLARLRPSAERPPERPSPAVRVQAAARSDVSDELDLRGLPAQEARERVRRFVDEAALAGLASARVVHGRGTGALRQATRDELAAHPLVERTEADSGDGATVAYLA
jgi:DNA mismatch repair protein MutS2